MTSRSPWLDRTSRGCQRFVVVAKRVLLMPLALALVACTPQRPSNLAAPRRSPNTPAPVALSSNVDAIDAVASAWMSLPLDVPVIAIHQENLLLPDPAWAHDPAFLYRAEGAIRLVAARYLLDGVPLSVRSALDVFPEQDVELHRPPPTEWYYTRAKKDETLREEGRSLVWAGRVSPGDHILVSELVYTLPRCCYAGCFPKLLVTVRREERFEAGSATARLFRFRLGSLESEARITTPLEERIKLRTSVSDWRRGDTLVLLVERPWAPI
jgi:hypothetical protein